VERVIRPRFAPIRWLAMTAETERVLRKPVRIFRAPPLIFTDASPRSGSIILSKD
jgi:hypothetical protein